MEIAVSVGGWEHMCCGKSIALGGDVAWEVVRYDGALHETHHVPEPGSVGITGRVTAVQARFDGGESVAVMRVPSGRALCGFDPDDAAELIAAETGAAVTQVAGGFIVTLEVADHAELPT